MATINLNGNSALSLSKREDTDYYATPPEATKCLLEKEKFNETIWEPCCGGGHIANVLLKEGYKVKASDKYDHGYGHIGLDFLRIKENKKFDIDIVTNPPYSFAQEFVEKSIRLLNDGCKIAMFLKIQFLETKSRQTFFEKYPPTKIYVSSSRFVCAKNGNFYGQGSMICYCWYIWNVGDYSNAPQIFWIH
jgi:hypothetical protein